jgi:hypothetical protein
MLLTRFFSYYILQIEREHLLDNSSDKCSYVVLLYLKLTKNDVERSKTKK